MLRQRLVERLENGAADDEDALFLAPNPLDDFVRSLRDRFP